MRFDSAGTGDDYHVIEVSPGHLRYAQEEMLFRPCRGTDIPLDNSECRNCGYRFTRKDDDEAKAED